MRTDTDADAPPPRSPTSSVLRAKLRVPSKSERYVRRPRLLALLDAAATAPITLIVAPAGSGKTTLAAGWVAESRSPCAWVSLDSTDRDARQFWTSVIAALQTVAPGCGEAATLCLRASGTAAQVVEALLDELDSTDCQVSVLVIDDLQEVDEDETVAATLGLFVQHLPAWLRLVLLSRRDPQLPRDRLRARGELSEVRFVELRFTPDEATQLMSRLAPALPDDRVAAVSARAEGWAAGLQLAALAARSERAQQGFEVPVTAGDLLVQDYVLHEVLAAETPELIETLSKVAVVDRVNPSLAEALTGSPDAGVRLAQAEKRGLFVTRLGPERWFELHSLLRATLTAELASRSPAQLAELHERAARWFEQTAEVPLALEHWLRADRPRDALRLLAASTAELYDSGREATIRRTIARIGWDSVSDDLESVIDLAWCHLLVNRRRFIEVVDQATSVAEQSPPNELSRARLNLLRGVAATVGGRWTGSGSLARQALRDLGQAWWRDPICRIAWNVVAREVALSERWDDTRGEAREAGIAVGRHPQRRVAYEGTRALGQALAGRPVEALQAAAGVRRLASVPNMTILRAELATAEAIAHREIADMPRAMVELDALAEAHAETMLYCRILACTELVHAHLDQGDIETANETFRQAQALTDSESFGLDGRACVNRTGVVLALATGQVDQAGRMAELIRDPFWHSVSVTRVHLARGQRADALAALESATPRCVRHDVLLGLLRARASNNRDEAVKSTAVAVGQAAAVGLLQTVVAEGSEVVELVERAAWGAPSSWLDRFRRAAGSYGTPPAAGDPIVPLTEREREVLRFLPSRLTVREIADELYISVNTLKFHLKVIYRKLGVSSRGDAAAAARRLARLPRQP